MTKENNTYKNLWESVVGHVDKQYLAKQTDSTFVLEPYSPVARNLLIQIVKSDEVKLSSDEREGLRQVWLQSSSETGLNALEDGNIPNVLNSLIDRLHKEMDTFREKTKPWIPVQPII